jgi:hypothetical protein
VAPGRIDGTSQGRSHKARGWRALGEQEVLFGDRLDRDMPELRQRVVGREQNPDLFVDHHLHLQTAQVVSGWQDDEGNVESPKRRSGNSFRL